MVFLRNGNILWVNLSSGKTSTSPLSPYSGKLFGGRAISAMLLYELVPPEIKADDPGNALIFSTGPLTGTLVPGSSQLGIMAKSPATGMLGYSNIGGYAANVLKYAGYDHLVILGMAEQPVFIVIDNDDVFIRDAFHLWGKDTYFTQFKIKEELNEPDMEVLCIGKAGENLVHYASIVSSVGNTPGRSGLGAVMGSKNLKAIALKGNQSIKISHSHEFMQESLKAQDLVKNSGMKEILLSNAILSDLTLGDRTTRYFVDANEERGIEAYELVKSIFSRNIGCVSCPLQCMVSYYMPEEGYSVVLCQSNLENTNVFGLNDFKQLWRFISLCQQEGIDSASLGEMLALARLLYKTGIINEKDTDGISLNFGDGYAFIEMAYKIINREGLGDVLANNAILAMEQLGIKADEYQMNSEGKALTNLINNYKLYRCRDGFLAKRDKVTKKSSHFDKKALLFKNTEDAAACAEIVGGCKYHTFLEEMSMKPQAYARLLSAGLDCNVNVDELLMAVERLKTVERTYNARENIIRSNDILNQSGLPNLENTKQITIEYYKLRGWDLGSGIPCKKILYALELKDIADDLESRGVL